MESLEVSKIQELMRSGSTENDGIPASSKPIEYTPTSFWRFFWIRVRYHTLAVTIALVCVLALMGVQIMFILNPSNVSVTDAYCTEFHTLDKQLARIITASIIWLTTFIDFVIAWCFEAEEEVRLSGAKRKKMKSAWIKFKSKFSGLFYEFRPMGCAGAKPEIENKSEGYAATTLVWYTATLHRPTLRILKSVSKKYLNQPV